MQFEENFSPIRAIEETILELAASQVPLQGFGVITSTYDKVSTRGMIRITKKVEKVFTPRCECPPIASPDGFGPPCVVCLAELRVLSEQGHLQHLNLSNDPAVREKQLRWLAKPCKDCSRVCAYEWCKDAICKSHSESGLDEEDEEKSFCPQHAFELGDELMHKQLQESKGLVIAWLTKSLRSLTTIEGVNNEATPQQHGTIQPTLGTHQPNRHFQK